MGSSACDPGLHCAVNQFSFLPNPNELVGGVGNILNLGLEKIDRIAFDKNACIVRFFKKAIPQPGDDAQILDCSIFTKTYYHTHIEVVGEEVNLAVGFKKKFINIVIRKGAGIKIFAQDGILPCRFSAFWYNALGNSSMFWV